MTDFVTATFIPNISFAVNRQMTERFKVLTKDYYKSDEIDDSVYCSDIDLVVLAKERAVIGLDVLLGHLA